MPRDDDRLKASLKNHDLQILRELGKRIRDAAELPVQDANRQLWKAVNSLANDRPAIRITEVPWHEVVDTGHVRLACVAEECRDLELELRKRLYQWERFPGDQVVEASIACPMAVADDGFGFCDEEKVVRTDAHNDVCAHAYTPQITSAADVAKIRNTTVVHDQAKTEAKFTWLSEIFDGILTVERKGVSVRVAPWDMLITWLGVQDGLMYLYTEPEMVHEAISRLVDVHLDRLDQYERLGVLTLNTGCDQVGSGGFGYTDELPGPGFSPGRVRSRNMWGSSTAQIFCCVSPEMHEAFALDYEVRWLNRFGLTYYGCCDPLDRKVDMLQKVANLRKVSMSRWIDIERGTANIGNRYVFSYKPNPGCFAEENWSLDEPRQELDRLFTSARQHGCRVEVIMKNISTMRSEPERLSSWADMAAEMVDKHYGKADSHRRP